MRTSAVLSRDPAAGFTVETVDIDEPRAGEVLVRIVAAGVCHTDLVSRRAGAVDRPVLLGHEGAGVVEAIGPGVSVVRPGDHVVLTFRHCGDCVTCRAGRPAYCRRANALNQFGRRANGTPRVTVDGAPILDGFFGQSSFAGYALAAEDNTVVIDPATDLAVAAPFGCGFQTGMGAVLNVLRPEPGSWLAIYGAGAVGTSALLAARTIPDVRVAVVETSAARRDMALALGADAAIDPTEAPTTPAIRDLTGGGATHALDTTGVASVLGDAVAALTTGATVVAVGLGAGTPPVDISDIVLYGKTIRGCLEGDAVPGEFIPRLLDLHARGLLPADRLITRYPHTEIGTALEDQRAGRVIKPVLTW
ncbi:NAD(P)-dependent alcohol dehydrogenase [Nocardia cyriacigeorgica]|uniref:NAD(P)-dependent alcohol dehydrogenase n=1 Tax=Nocardia cyriacigeorgica TaxID=135487 RepID=A0A6P1DDU7_9NOCA|nr:NAD(P)-dependent alcohol dehydrogenase [Nocardia cyriacigeorgica]NEW37356.1 NAD(P)-dependent alcohol dehydrogenase [Nocardia cyriacigeorgica]NEW46783.1 NAD(P)-dependent alcohol dehydrogenase [Nocardia cyriacigeorgica]NEW50554.1 NAD(P)-dependent alcohol dehydrogenase [Nocardia cyriacigeorgica]NEW57706.1 NAD(P)-dependent alcohol dehydrogenase [Nocardia cyriacigeorgica]